MHPRILDLARQRAWLAVPIAGLVLLVAFFALPGGSTEQSIVYDMLGFGVVAGAILGILLHRPAGWRAWLLLALGQLAFVGGDLIWTIYSAIGEDPFPSPADALYLLGYPVMAIGLALAIRRRITGGDRAGLLDAAILATGTAVVWWALVLGPLAASADPDPLSFAISVAYPIGDLLLLGMALGLVMTPGTRSISFGLLVTSLVLLLVADLEFGIQNIEGTYVDGSWLDGAWMLAYLAFGTAALHPSMAGFVEPRPVSVTLLGPVRLLLLAVAMLIGPIVLTIGRSDADAIIIVVAIATAVLSVLVLTRLAGMVRHLDRDIERRKTLEAQLSFQAYHDPLTGLANRRRFMAATAEALTSGSGTAALFLDLDDFKHVNDEQGHDAGDDLLAAIGLRLVAGVRPGDLAARLGGDEFAVLLPHTADVAAAEAVADRLLAALAEPVEIEGRPLRVTASIGLAMASPGESTVVDDLIRRADVAMYRAKARGKHCRATYRPDLEVAGDPAIQARIVVRRAEGAA